MTDNKQNGSDGLTLRELSAQSWDRSKRWLNGDMSQWSLLEWAGSMAGEAGEACNVAKKLKLIEHKLVNAGSERPMYDTGVAKFKIAWEATDTLLYAIVLIKAAGYDPESMIRDVFNAKSIECGFPERI